MVKLIEARHHVELAGKKAASALDDARTWAPAKLPPPTGSGGPGIKDIVTAPWHFVHGFYETWSNSLLGSAYIGTPEVERYADKVQEGLDESSPAMVTLLSTLLMFAGARGAGPEALPEVPTGTATADELLKKELGNLAEQHGMTAEQLAALKNGKGPYLKGLAAENVTAQMATDAGYDVAGRQIDAIVNVDGRDVKIRLDLALRDTDEKLIVADSKNGPNAGLTDNAKIAYPVMRNEGWIGVGKNAENAGLAGPHGPTPVWEVYYNR